MSEHVVQCSLPAVANSSVGIDWVVIKFSRSRHYQVSFVRLVTRLFRVIAYIDLTFVCFDDEKKSVPVMSVSLNAAICGCDSKMY